MTKYIWSSNHCKNINNDDNYCSSLHFWTIELNILFFLLRRQYITNYCILSKVLCELWQLVLLSCVTLHISQRLPVTRDVMYQSRQPILSCLWPTGPYPWKQALKRGGDWAHCPIPLLEHELLHRLPKTSLLLAILLICNFYQRSALAWSHYNTTKILFCFHLFNRSISFRNYSF